MKKNIITWIIFIIFILWYWFYHDQSLIWKDYFSLNFFDLKVWDWILIKTPEDKIILIDWWVWDEMVSKISKKMWFFERKVDYIFVSHYDSDHISWLISIIRKFQIGKIFILKYEKNSPYFDEFMKILNNRKINFEFYSDSKNFFIEKNLFFKNIFPLNNYELKKFSHKTNFSSVFELYVWKSKTKFLFTGDIEKNIEKYLVKNDRIDKLNYLKVAHHWSKTSSSTWFILKANPEFWIICAAKDNPYWHPNMSVLTRLKKFWVKVLQTWLEWDIELKIN